jgi:hypothetical protein
MQSIKALVVFMGLLILAGLGLLVYGVVNQVSEVAAPGPPDTPGAPGADPGAPGAPGTPGTRGARGGFDAASVALPAGCVLAEARLEDGRLVLRAGGPLDRPDCQQVILLDPESGAELGRVKIAPQP